MLTEELKILKDKITRLETNLKANLADLSDRDQRHFDNAYKAVNVEELDFVVENTGSRSVQDYALVKIQFFTEKNRK